MPNGRAGPAASAIQKLLPETYQNNLFVTQTVPGGTNATNAVRRRGARRLPHVLLLCPLAGPCSPMPSTGAAAGTALAPPPVHACRLPTTTHHPQPPRQQQQSHAHTFAAARAGPPQADIWSNMQNTYDPFFLYPLSALLADALRDLYFDARDAALIPKGGPTQAVCGTGRARSPPSAAATAGPRNDALAAGPQRLQGELPSPAPHTQPPCTRLATPPPAARPLTRALTSGRARGGSPGQRGGTHPQRQGKHRACCYGHACRQLSACGNAHNACAGPATPALQVTYNPNNEDLPIYMPAWSFDGAAYQAAHAQVRMRPLPLLSPPARRAAQGRLGLPPCRAQRTPV